MATIQSDSPEPKRGVSVARAASTWAYLLIGGGTTGYLWMGLSLDPQAGGILTGVLWLLVVMGIASRTKGRRLAAALKATRSVEETIHAHRPIEADEARSGAALHHVATWLVVVLGLAATGVVWSMDSFASVLGEHSTPVLGGGLTLMLALAVAANAINRRKARRLLSDFRTAVKGEKFALDTLRSVDTMISACVPGGERTEFNSNFLNALGRTFEELQGKGWLDAVQADDRQSALALFSRPLGPNEKRRQHDVCMQKKNGDFVWLRETIVPRFDEQGTLVEFICTAIDISDQVNNETSLDERIGTLTRELAASREEATATKAELAKAKTSRNRFQKNLDESRDEIKRLTDCVESAEGRMAGVEGDAKERIAHIEEATRGRLASLKEEISSFKLELKQAKVENSKLNRAYQKLQEEMSEFRHEEIERREQTTRRLKEVREAKVELSEAQAREAAQRAKISRLTSRCEELEQQLSSNDDALKTARTEAERMGGEMAEQVARQSREVSGRALAGELSRHLEGVTRMMKDLREASLDGPPREALHNTDAFVRTMTELVDQTLGNARATAPGGPAASFRLNDTMDGVLALLADESAEQGVTLTATINKSVPALVHGDEVALRAAIRSIVSPALRLVNDGELTLKLSQDLATDAHATIRCELAHASARIKPDKLTEALALESTDENLPDPVRRPAAYQASQAWRVIRGLDGAHGFQQPDTGGFTVWFTFNLGRLAAAAGATEEIAPISSPAAEPPAAEPPRLESESPPPADPQVNAARGEAAMPGARPKGEEATPGSRTKGEAAMPGARTKGEAAMPGARTKGAAAMPGARPRGAEAMPAATQSREESAATSQSSASDDPSSGTMPRVPQEFLSCNLGEVGELGGDSILIKCSKSRKKGQLATIAFPDLQDEAIELKAKVKWSKKLGSRKYEVCFEFTGIMPGIRRQIMSIAIQHRKVTTMLGLD